MWSLGVVWLELVLATPHVFQISPRTAALLERHLHHKSPVAFGLLTAPNCCPPDLHHESPVTVGILCCAPDLICCGDAAMPQDDLILWAGHCSMYSIVCC